MFGEKLTFISEPDNGIYDAINKGLSMATCDVVGFLNTDNYFSSPYVLRIVAKALETMGVDLVYGDVCYVRQQYRQHSPLLFGREFQQTDVALWLCSTAPFTLLSSRIV